MIKSITITNHLGESCEMVLARPDLSGFLIQRIGGLGPPKADINMTDLATNDGARYNSSRVTPRNIVIDFIFYSPEGNVSIEQIRRKSYKYFPIKKKIKFLIETDDRVCETFGVVESNEPNIFSSQEGCSISIVCPDPYFYSTGENGKTVSVFYGITPNFEFDFSNESLTTNEIEFSVITQDFEQTIVYDGDADIGVVITMHAFGPVKNVSIFNTMTNESMRFDTDRLLELTGSGIIASDTITISTIKGDKYVMLLRSGVYYNILNCLDKDADWFQLQKGDNIFAYAAEEGFTNLEFRIENQTMFEGV